MPIIQDTIIPINPDDKLYILWDGKEKDITVDISLDFPGTGIEVYGILLGKNKSELNLNLTITHNAQNTRSKVILKGLLTDETNVNFNGLVSINKGAKQTDAWLSCYYLLLSKKAKGRAIPSLEIEENDVKAGHATTASKPSAKELFYLQTRGLTQDQARSLLIEGFVEDVLRFMPRDTRARAREELKHGF